MSHTNKREEQEADTALTVPEAAATKVRTHMVQSLVLQGDKLLAVRRGSAKGVFWELPGALTRMTDEEEDFETCQARGLLECAGLETSERYKIYEGPNTVVFAVGAREPSVTRKLALTCGWLSPQELLKNTERPALMKAVYASFERAGVTASNVISKLKDGRILYAIQYETSADGGHTYEPHEAHYVHAMNQADARAQFLELRPALPGVRVNIVAVAPAIGFHESTQEGVLLG